MGHVLNSEICLQFNRKKTQLNRQCSRSLDNSDIVLGNVYRELKRIEMGFVLVLCSLKGNNKWFRFPNEKGSQIELDLSRTWQSLTCTIKLDRVIHIIPPNKIGTENTLWTPNKHVIAISLSISAP